MTTATPAIKPLAAALFECGTSMPVPERHFDFALLGKTWAAHYQETDGNDHGECDHTALKILVDPQQPVDHIKDTVLHETVHAIDLELGLKMSETQVSRLA